MRNILASLALAALPLLAQASPEGYWVFGDSLSSEKTSWASQLVAITHIQNLAVAGSQLTKSTIPSQLSCRNREVIYWLGTNDAGSGVDEYTFKAKLSKHLSTFARKKCKVHLVLPISVNLTPTLARNTSDARRWVKETATLFGLKTLDAPYNERETTDGLHPTPGAHFWLAVWFANALNIS